MDTIIDPVVAAASAAFGSPLNDPVDLGGGHSTTVLRCRTGNGGTVVVKSYQDDAAGRSCFAAEAAGLGFTSAGPELLAVHADEPLIVMSDLGTAPNLADALLDDSPDVARAGVLAWARGYGSLAAATLGRQADLAALRATYRRGTAGHVDEDWAADSVTAFPGTLAEFGVSAPEGLASDLAEVIELTSATDHLVFSPGDICPDNNILTDDGLRVLDFEAAGYHSVFLDAAYATMPFASCWCVFRLPPGLAAGRRNPVAQRNPAGDGNVDHQHHHTDRRADPGGRTPDAPQPPSRAHRPATTAPPLAVPGRRADADRPTPGPDRGHASPAHRHRIVAGSPAAALPGVPTEVAGAAGPGTRQAAPESLPLPPGLDGCPGLDQSAQRLRQRALVQDAEALGGAGEGDVEFGRAAWAVGEDPCRVHDQDGVELQPLRLRRHHRARHSRRPDHHAGALAAGFVAHELLDGGQFVLGDTP
jgi:hypothetical protein